MFRKLTYLAAFVLVLGVIPQSVGQGADPSLVGWWTFDDGAGTTPLDSSDYGRHGEFVGDPQWGTGNIGGALATSAGNYVVIPGYTGILGISARTCTAWIKTTTADGVIIGWGLLSGGNKWIMRVNQVGGGGELRCEVMWPASWKTTGHPISRRSNSTWTEFGTPTMRISRMSLSTRLRIWM